MGKDNFVAASPSNGRMPTPDILGQVLTAKYETEAIVIENIRKDGATQMRAGLNPETVAEYAEAMISGWGKFPPMVVYYDGHIYWLADGFHRMAAFMKAFPAYMGLTVPCEVRAGTQRDAILHAAGANANHGLRRTNADKRRAVDVLLRDPEWVQLSDREIARICAVSNHFVGDMRSEMTVNGSQSPTVRTGGDGRVYNTTNIGRVQQQPAPERKVEDDGWIALNKNGWMYVHLIFDLQTTGYNTKHEAAAAVRNNQLERLMPSVRAEVEKRPERPAFDNKPVMMTIAQLEDEVKDMVPLYYREPHEIANAPADMRACAKAGEGGFWKMVTMQLGNNWNARDLKIAIELVSPTVPSLVSGTPELNTARTYASTQTLVVVIRTWIDNCFKMPDSESLKVTRLTRMLADHEDGAWVSLEKVLPAPYTEANVHAALKQVLDQLNGVAVLTSVADETEPVHPLDVPEDTDEFGDKATFERLAMPRRMRDLWELKDWFKQTIEDKLDEFGELTGRHTLCLPAQRALEDLMEVLENEMDALQHGADAIALGGDALALETKSP